MLNKLPNVKIFQISPSARLHQTENNFCFLFIAFWQILVSHPSSQYYTNLQRCWFVIHNFAGFCSANWLKSGWTTGKCQSGIQQILTVSLILSKWPVLASFLMNQNGKWTSPLKIRCYQGLRVRRANRVTQYILI